MRLLGRLLTLLAGLLLMGWAAWSGWNGLHGWIAGGDLPTLTRLGTAQTSLIYTLDSERWTRFPFSTPQQATRLITHADVAATYRDDAEAEFRYSIVVQITDSDDATLREFVLNQRVGIAAVRDGVTNEVFTTAAYVDATEIPTAAVTNVIDLSALPRPAAGIRLRLLATAPDIRRVAVRVYERTLAGERRLAVQWRRLLPEQRVRLAEGNVYPPELLTDVERTNALRQQWKPIGPSGIEGRDWRGRSLFMLKDLVGDPIEPPALSPWMFVDSHHNATLRLPEQGSRLTLRVEPVAHLGAATSGILRVVWYGSGLAQRAEENLPWSSQMADLRIEHRGGLLELSSDQPIAVRAFLPDGTEFTPKTSYLRAFVASPGLPVDFRVLHLKGSSATSIRIDVRCLCFDPLPARGQAVGTPGSLPAAALLTGGAIPEIGYEILAVDGKQITRGMTRLTAEPSRYDRLLGQDPLRVSEPMKLHFDLPPEAVSLRLSASSPVLLAAYDRPPDLPWRVMVPEDQFAPVDPLSARPAWFGMRPADWDGLLATNRSVLLAVQPRPPEDDPELLAGRYDWEQFMPLGNWLAREILVRREATPVRRLALSAIFSPLPNGREVEVEVIESTPGGTTAMPLLMVLRDQSGPTSIRLEVDGRLHFSVNFAAARGTLQVPPIPVGTRRLRVVADEATRLYLNQIQPLPEALISRRGIRLSPGDTVFDFEKRLPAGGETQELVIMHFYGAGAAGEVARQNVAVTIEGPLRGLGPHLGFTLRDRIWDIRRGPEPPDVRILGAEGVIGPERLLFLPFGPDLPAGIYRLRVRLGGGPEALLAISRTTPGLVDRRDIRRELVLPK